MLVLVERPLEFRRRYQEPLPVHSQDQETTVALSAHHDRLSGRLPGQHHLDAESKESAQLLGVALQFVKRAQRFDVRPLILVAAVVAHGSAPYPSGGIA